MLTKEQIENLMVHVFTGDEVHEGFYQFALSAFELKCQESADWAPEDQYELLTEIAIELGCIRRKYLWPAE
jgi:hypothetical protein